MARIPTTLIYYPNDVSPASAAFVAIPRVCAYIVEHLGNPARQVINLACAKEADDQKLENMAMIASRPPPLLRSTSFRFIHWTLGWQEGTSDQFEITFAKEGPPWVALQYDAINATAREAGEENFKNAGRAIIKAGVPAVVVATDGCYGLASIIYTHLARGRSGCEEIGATRSVEGERRPIFVPASKLQSWFEAKRKVK